MRSDLSPILRRRRLNVEVVRAAALVGKRSPYPQFKCRQFTVAIRDEEAPRTTLREVLQLVFWPYWASWSRFAPWRKTTKSSRGRSGTPPLKRCWLPMGLLPSRGRHQRQTCNCGSGVFELRTREAHGWHKDGGRVVGMAEASSPGLIFSSPDPRLSIATSVLVSLITQR
jgi:hypothetical protein